MTLKESKTELLEFISGACDYLGLSYDMEHLETWTIEKLTEKADELSDILDK